MPRRGGPDVGVINLLRGDYPCEVEDGAGAGRDQLVERGEVPVDGGWSDARPAGYLLPVSGDGAALGVECHGGIDDPCPGPVNGLAPGPHPVSARHTVILARTFL